MGAEAVAEIKSMGSYRGSQFFVDAGDNLRKTENCFSWAGAVNLVNEDEDAMWQDYRR